MNQNSCYQLLTSKYTAMLVQTGLRPGPQWASMECSPDLLARRGGHFLTDRRGDKWEGKRKLPKGMRWELAKRVGCPGALLWVGTCLVADRRDTIYS